MTKMLKKIPDDETRKRIDAILDWCVENKWFDAAFVIKMDRQSSWSHRQAQAIINIYEHFVKGKNK